MKTPKTNGKPKATTSRKSVVKAIATQEKENKKEFSLHSPEIQEAIRLQAYELYLQRGGVHGSDVEDWATAEKIILQSR
jgi:hypothetical protein